MEIMGLLIIVILVSLGMFFFILFQTSSGNVDNSPKKEYAYNELSTSFISTLLKTSACGETIDALITDCATYRRIRCGFGVDSCQKVEEVTLDILNKTIDLWNLAYGFEIRYSNNKRFNISKYDCNNETVGRGVPGIYTLSLYPSPGNAEIELGICK